MATHIAPAVIFGIKPMRPIVNLPTDAKRIKISMRANDVCRAFVRYEDRIEHWFVVPTNNTLSSPDWMIDLLQGVNKRIESGSKGDQGGCVIESGGRAVCVKEKE